jgi:hypothetical protein
VIRDAVLHLINEQPLLIDLFEAPSPDDSVLVGTNLRTMSRTRPLFAERADSTFVFPYAHIRFVELPVAAAASESPQPIVSIQLAEPEPEPDLEVDEDFLRRVREL